MESRQDLRRRYSKIEDNWCKDGYKAYRPKTKSDCPIRRHLLINLAPDLVAQEHLYIEEGRCKGYVRKV